MRDDSEPRHHPGRTSWCGDRKADLGADSNDTAEQTSQSAP
jgi:hypothetical protein